MSEPCHDKHIGQLPVLPVSVAVSACACLSLKMIRSSVKDHVSGPSHRFRTIHRAHMYGHKRWHFRPLNRAKIVQLDHRSLILVTLRSSQIGSSLPVARNVIENGAVAIDQ